MTDDIRDNTDKGEQMQTISSSQKFDLLVVSDFPKIASTPIITAYLSDPGQDYIVKECSRFAEMRDISGSFYIFENASVTEQENQILIYGDLITLYDRRRRSIESGDWKITEEDRNYYRFIYSEKVSKEKPNRFVQWFKHLFSFSYYDEQVDVEVEEVFDPDYEVRLADNAKNSYLPAKKTTPYRLSIKGPYTFSCQRVTGTNGGQTNA